MKLTKKNQRRYKEKEKEANSERKSLSGVQKAEICRLKERGVSQVTIAKQPMASCLFSTAIRWRFYC